MPEPTFAAPETLDEALRLAADPGAVVVGGGTALALLLKQRLLDPSGLVWLGRLGDLRAIRAGSDGELRIGATATLAELAASPVVRARHPMVARAASLVGNPRVRSVATVGGALVHADPRQDLLPALLAADARATVTGPDGTSREVPLRDGFFRGFLETAVGEGELLTHVLLPGASDASERYVRFTPASRDDYPTVSVAARVRTTPEGEVAGIALALGGVASTPVLVQGLGGLLGRRPGPADVEAAAEAAREATAPTDDERGSAEYKAAMARLWTQRVLTDLLRLPGEAVAS